MNRGQGWRRKYDYPAQIGSHVSYHKLTPEDRRRIEAAAYRFAELHEHRFSCSRVGSGLIVRRVA